jgi:hypothetical protein
MSEPVTTTTASVFMPSPIQCVIAGVALGFGATLGYKFACASSEAVSEGLQKSNIKERVKALMKKKEEQPAEQPQQEAATVELKPAAKKSVERLLKDKSKNIKWDQKKFNTWAKENARDLNKMYSLGKLSDPTEDQAARALKIGMRLQKSATAAGLLRAPKKAAPKK